MKLFGGEIMTDNNLTRDNIIKRVDYKVSSKDERLTGLVLGTLSVALTSCIIFWFIGNPQRFIEHRLGINSNAFDYPIAWLFVILISFGYVFYTSKAVPFVGERLFTFSWLKIIGIWAAIVSSIVEEILFRQVLMDWINNEGYSVVVQIIVSALIFGLAHGAWVLLRGELKVALPIILSTTVLGGLLAFVYIISERHILAPIVAHILINLMIEPWLMLSAISQKWNVKSFKDK